MKTLKFYAFLGTIVAALILSGCSKENDLDQPNYGSSSENLSGQELEGLTLLVEKHKLHKDVYFTLFEKTNNPLFDNLYHSDAQLFDLLSNKIADYGQINPVGKMGVGEFRSLEIQNLYDEFLKTFETGMIQTLTFAIEMEEGTSEDIQNCLAQIEGNGDIALLYTDLLTESISQLDALVSELKSLVSNGEPTNPVKET